MEEGNEIKTNENGYLQENGWDRERRRTPHCTLFS